MINIRTIQHYMYCPRRFGLLEIENVIEALKTKRKGLHVIITGRYAREELIAVADMVSEINEINHQFRNGIPALKGIDI